ncbi:PucR family transcriptional regulator [Leucobacter sp. W1478]|uniref:PucR family transcriptional regulator n=1 Tax=Leucobacter sp. W1478 TaxID=3439065 RepID=UPI003F345106
MAELEPRTATLLGPHDEMRIISGADFYDALEPLADAAGTVLFAPSAVDIEGDHLTRIAEEAALRQYSAIAVKCRDCDTDSFAQIAESSGIPFIRISDLVSWRLFDALLAQFLGEHGDSADAHRDRGAEPLFSLANELAGFFGGSVAIEDLGRRIIAYSSVPDQLIDNLRTQGILTRHVPESPFNDDQYRTVLRTENPIKYPRLEDEEPRVACAIRAGALPLGTIWAIDASGEAPLTRLQEERIRAAASVAAAYMLDDIRMRKATQVPRENRLRTLLDGHEVLGVELAELGISEERGAALLAFSPAESDHHATPSQLRSTVQRHLAVHRPEAVAVVRGARVYALIANDPSRPATGLVEPLLPILDRLMSPGTLVAVPGVANRPAEVSQLCELADRLLNTALSHPSAVAQRVLTVEALRPFLVFERAAAMFASEPELRLPELDRIWEGDPRLAETLLEWCNSSGNVAQAARRLTVHENTVRYRLRQIQEECGIDLFDPDTLLTTWLQLRVQAHGA